MSEIEFEPPVLQPPESWQEEDILYAVERLESDDGRVGSANWSEMGCKKTTTGLWAIKKYIEDEGIENPNILIITTRTGKGTFFQWCPQILEGWTIIDIDTRGMKVLLNNKLVSIPKVKEFPEDGFAMPTVVVSHFHVFSKSNHGQFEIHPITQEPMKNKDGGLIMKAPTQADRINKHEWDVVWLDECHRIKDKDARWTVVIKRGKGKKRMVSSGTGFINRPHEIWSSLNFLDKKRWGSFWSFYDEYCEVDESSGYARVTGVKPDKLNEFRTIVREYGPRRTLDEVMPHIKKPYFQAIDVELSPAQRRMYDAIRSELYALDQQGVPLYAANVLSLLQRLRAICVATPEVVEDYYDPNLDRRVQKIRLTEPSSKLDALMELIDGMQWDEENRQAVVVFSNFVGPLNLLQARFEKANSNAMEMGFDPEYPYIWLKESDKDDVRYNKWANLFPSMEYRVFMSTLQVGGESINLTPARHVVFLDRSWSPKDNAQGIGRIRRPGQEGQPIVYNINARNTTDQYIERVVRIKQNWFNEIFGEENGENGS
jgi:SNF2 family DNA or RNA helicase